jgi:predicted nucleotidyltransferase
VIRIFKDGDIFGSQACGDAESGLSIDVLVVVRSTVRRVRNETTSPVLLSDL